MNFKVNVTTFKTTGKFYDEIIIAVTADKDEWYHIIEGVRRLRKNTGTSLEWLIGMDDSRDDMYPKILKD